MQTTIRIAMLERKPLGLALVSVVGGLLVAAAGRACAWRRSRYEVGREVGDLRPGGPAARATARSPPAPGAPPRRRAQGQGRARRGGHKIYRITEEIRIEGKIQKPEAFFFYQKSSINYDWQELKQDFIPKILDSVSKAPF